MKIEKGTPTQRMLAIQQAVMKVRGFYDGAIDGSWGPKAVNAMRDWSLDASFDPALPTRGYPLSSPSRLPKGLVWQPGVANTISYALLPEAERKEVDALLATFEPLTASAINDQLEPKQEVKPVEVKTEVQPTPPPTQQNQQQQNQNVARNGQQQHQHKK